MKRKISSLPLLILLVGVTSVFQTQLTLGYTLDELLKITSQIKNEKPGITFELKTDKEEYRVGEDVVIRFKADKDCYLALIDIGTSGKATILFPNKWHPDNFVEKDKAYIIPPLGSEFAYKVLPPAGLEHIKAIASIEPVMSKIESLQEELKQPIETKPEKGQVFLSMKDPGVVLKDIGIEFKKLDPSKWATKEHTFKIVETGPESKPTAGEKPTSSSRTKPAESTEVYKSKSGSYEIWYDPSKWKIGPSTNPASETAFFHYREDPSDIQVNVIYQPQSVPMPNVKKGFLGNLQKVASDIVVKQELEITLNQAPVTVMTVNNKIQGIDGVFQAYLWSGDSGVIQFLGVCVQDLFPELKDDIERLLNGLVILKP